MPTAEVDIANRALQAVGGKGRITALDAAQAAVSREAAVCYEHFDNCRDSTLADADWPFARHRVDLSALSEDTQEDWVYVYAYPDNCLRVRKVVAPDTSTPVPYEVSLNAAGTARVILCDTEDAIAVYTRLIEDPNLWSPWFDAALGYRLAMAIALPLAGTTATDILKTVQQAYLYALSRALSGVRQEGRAREPAEAASITARY